MQLDQKVKCLDLKLCEEKYKSLKLPLLIIKAIIAAKSKINPDAASNLKKYLKGFVMCWIIASIYFYKDYLSIAKKA